MHQNNYSVIIHKTTKINIDESSHFLPPSCGFFTEYKVADYYCPDEWSNDGVFIPVDEGVPMWFDFRQSPESAVIPSVQRLNPVTGEPVNFNEGLTKDPKQNYLRLPEQLWLDGYAKDGIVYQFVVTKAGIGLAVSEYVLPLHMQDSHALGFAFYSPKNPKPRHTLLQFGQVPESHSSDKMLYYNPKFSYSKSRYRVSGQTAHSVSDSTDTVNVLRSTSVSAQTHAISCNSVNIANTQSHDNAVTFDAVECNNVAISTDFASCDSTPNKETLNQCDKASMGMGGRIQQKIYTDENTVDYYKDKPDATLVIYFALPDLFEKIMKHGPKQNYGNKDKYKMSGIVGGVPVPLI